MDAMIGLKILGVFWVVCAIFSGVMCAYATVSDNGYSRIRAIGAGIGGFFGGLVLGIICPIWWAFCGN